jgi:hypothetical protein
MTERNTADGLDFEALRESIERCDLDVMLGFYAEEAELRIVNAGNPQSLPFELRGKAEIAKHLRATFGQETSHRVEREVVDKNRVTFREMCEYPDGSWVRVETTLEVSDGKIVRQVDAVAQDAQADREEKIGRRALVRKTYPETTPEVDELQIGDL